MKFLQKNRENSIEWSLLQSSVRLVELGPRITMELIKIEEELHEGEVLYHKLVEKTEAEKKAIREEGLTVPFLISTG